MAFTSLAHLIDLDWLHEAYRLTRKDGAVGVDGQSADEYAVNLESNLRSLLERAKSGTYLAQPVRRAHIPKGSGHETRPIGIPTFEDKVLQRAVLMVLEPIYEQDFLDCSYGFRPGRSPHAALHELRERCMNEGMGWIVDADVSGYFDSIDRTCLREVLRKRVNDGSILRLIGKWLRAGVMDHGELTHPETGVVQGGVITLPTKWQTWC
jgi:group II intron reverse transcriptase/maturase